VHRRHNLEFSGADRTAQLENRRHTTPLLRELHWLRVPERIQFRFVCSGVPLCAWHSTGVPVRQPAADIRDRRSSLSSFCWHHDTAGAVDSSGYPWRPRLSGGCSAGMEQSATRDSGLLLPFDITKGDQVSPFSSVIRLTWRCPFRSSADVCVELCNSFRYKLCKVPPKLCDGSTIILTFVVVVGLVVLVTRVLERV